MRCDNAPLEVRIMKRFGVFMAFAAVMALMPTGLAEGKRPLQSDTTHTPGTEFVYPYLQTWEGPITGGLIDEGETGWIEWWTDVETWTAWPYLVAEAPLPNATHYEYEVRIYTEKGGDLILKAASHGTTTLANTTWRANGVVVEAPDHPDLVGRRVHESGRFLMGPEGPISGNSIFRIN